MKITQISRRMLSALTFACAMGMAPLAIAQTMTPAAPTGAMAPMSSMAPVAKTATLKAATKKTTNAAKLPKADEFKTVAEATAHCPSDTVVWSSLSKSKAYHLSSSKLFGKTKHGAYVCKGDADSFGFHAAKN
jgi:hypothetical protein